MTMLDTLFGLIPAHSRGQQWLAEELQLINWGGYDGPHRVRFSPGATLLCGGSGSGKSTLMDAYIALMMPHTTPFNGASNGGVTGRAAAGSSATSCPTGAASSMSRAPRRARACACCAGTARTPGRRCP